mmetsp:Transcript_95875/g.276887  ORF Transcript_95875/g.276887 Transcript_95875/m.276887 type:complete len:317 (-) Transcript_95875:293-1243(-)
MRISRDRLRVILAGGCTRPRAFLRHHHIRGEYPHHVHGDGLNLRALLVFLQVHLLAVATRSNAQLLLVELNDVDATAYMHLCAEDEEELVEQVVQQVQQVMARCLDFNRASQVHVLQVRHVVEHASHNLAEGLGPRSAPGVHDDVGCVVVVLELPDVFDMIGHTKPQAIDGGAANECRVVAGGCAARSDMRGLAGRLPLPLPVVVQDLHDGRPRCSDRCGQAAQRDALHVPRPVELSLRREAVLGAEPGQVVCQVRHRLGAQAPNRASPDRDVHDCVVLHGALGSSQQLVVRALPGRDNALVLAVALRHLARALLV